MDEISTIKDINTNIVYDIADDKNRENVAIIERGEEATQDIQNGQYVIWKGSLYIAYTNIATGTVLSDKNLTKVENGGLNNINNTIKTEINSATTYSYDYVSSRINIIPVSQNPPVPVHIRIPPRQMALIGYSGNNAHSLYAIFGQQNTPGEGSAPQIYELVQGGNHSITTAFNLSTSSWEVVITNSSNTSRRITVICPSTFSYWTE